MNDILNEFNNLKSNLDNLYVEDISNIDLQKTSVYIVDINNGFAKEGSLYSPRINSLIQPIVEFINSISDKVKNVFAFTDCHDENSIELLSYPSHCLVNTLETEIVDELKEILNIKIIPKNSTNGFFALEDNNFDDIDNIIIVGDCTDICVYQFAITLKSYFNQNNINKNIIVPMNLVDTYDIANVHPADLMNVVFLNSMIQNGIKVIKKFTY